MTAVFDSLTVEPSAARTATASVPHGFTSVTGLPRRLFTPTYLTAPASRSEVTRNPPRAARVKRPTKPASLGGAGKTRIDPPWLWRSDSFIAVRLTPRYSNTPFV